jgi:WD40 repeat protein
MGRLHLRLWSSDLECGEYGRSFLKKLRYRFGRSDHGRWYVRRLLRRSQEHPRSASRTGVLLGALTLGSGIAAAGLTTGAELTSTMEQPKWLTAVLWGCAGVFSVGAVVGGTSLTQWQRRRARLEVEEQARHERQRQEEAHRLAAEQVRMTAEHARVERRQADLRGHWSPRARGVERDSQPGWYFTGRTLVLRELVAWMTATPGRDGRARVVTGGPGSGKSAVLARLVTLDDRDYRATVPLADMAAGTAPPAGSIDVAVHANGKTVGEVVGQLADATGHKVRSPEALVAALLDRPEPKPLVIVVDALDEAAEPRQLARELLRPLAVDGGRVGLRLLVGTRRHLVGLLGAGSVVIDLDGVPYLERADLAEYVRRLLVREGEPGASTPYRDCPEVAATVAAVVAERAYPTFLVARLLGRALVDQPEVIEVTQPDWQARLPATVGDAMDAYLARFGDQEDRVRDLLAPLAWAEGAGLPRDALWVRLACALSDRSYGAGDVRWLLESAAAYLLESDDPDGRVVHRLFHQALADHLRAGHRAREVQRRYASALLDTVLLHAESPPGHSPGTWDRPHHRDWTAAHAYVRTHLATHAAAAGLLDGLLGDPGFVLAAEPGRLLPAVATAATDRSKLVAGIIERAGPHLLFGLPEERACYLELIARKSGADALADRIAELAPARPWSVPWAHWRAQSPHRLLGLQQGYVHQVAVVAHGEQAVVVSRSGQGVYLWNPTISSQAGALLVEEPPVTAMSPVPVANGAVLATGHADGTVRCWELSTRAVVGDPIGAHTDSVVGLGVARLDGRSVLASAGSDGLVRLWDAATGAQVGEPWQVPHPIRYPDGHHRDGHLLTIGSLGVEGCPAALTCVGSKVLLWDLAAHTQSGELTLSNDAEAWSGVITELDGRPVAVIGPNPRNRTVHLWHDLPSRDLPRELLPGPRIGVMSLAAGQPGGQRIVCAGGGDGTLHVWRWSQERPTAQILVAHDGGVDAVALAEINGRPVVVSGGRDGALRLWDLTAPPSIPAVAHRISRSVSTMTLATLHDQQVVVGITDADTDEGSTVQAWDLATGVSAATLALDGEQKISTIATVETRGQTLVVTGGARVLRIWDLAAQRLVDTISLETDSEVERIAIARDGDRALAAVGLASGTLEVWDLFARQPVGRPQTRHTGSFNLAVGCLDGRPIAVSVGGLSDRSDNRIRLWDLRTNTTPDEPFACSGTKLRQLGSVAVGALDQRIVAVAVGGVSHTRTWDLRTGSVLDERQLQDGHRMELNAVAIGNLDSQDVIVCSGYAGAISIWTLRDGIHRVIQTGSQVGRILLADESRIVFSGLMGLMAIRFADGALHRQHAMPDLSHLPLSLG